ncbi:helix-turn-helix domain-containing protein [Polycyclovorans algicola]|uniref:helix-turn-helix domain-containing protein n=1 Tax=Polycyclovorans algicola TaxID=616992 RepID=UPI0012687590|nr:helix-turn-helix transcriptional regulator [Polycyclovorans algicola]
MTLIELLDKAKEQTGSDPKTAEKIGVSKGALSHIRAGTRPLPIDAAVTLGKMLGLPWHQVVAAAEAHRRNCVGDQDGAKRWAKRTVAPGFVVGAALMMVCLWPQGAHAADFGTAINNLASNIHDIHYALF